MTAWIAVFVFAAWVLIARPELIAVALGFAFLVLIPMALRLIFRDTDTSHGANRLLAWLTKTVIVFAAFGVLSLVLPKGMLAGIAAVIWLVFCLLCALAGLGRLAARGFVHLEEFTLDAALIYLAAGGGWLVQSRGDLSYLLPYPGIIVDLTAIHFHYAAFLLPVIVGLFGRWLRSLYGEMPLLYPYMVYGVLAGMVLVAIGLDQGPPVEAILVVVYAVILLLLSVWLIGLSIKRMRGMAAFSAFFASMIMIFTISLAIVYSVGRAAGHSIVWIPEMIQWHGMLNAFGFATLGLIAFSRLSLTQAWAHVAFPISSVRSPRHPILKESQNKHQEPVGLIPSWEAITSPSFQHEKVSPLVRRFYEEPGAFHMKADLQWQRGFHAFSHLSSRITQRWGQINLPPSRVLEMTGNVSKLSDADGRVDVRFWDRRETSTGNSIFKALYAYHVHGNETYMNVALPLPGGVLTGVLKPLNEGNALVLTGVRRKSGCGDEGLYYTIGRWTWRLPLNETFLIVEKGPTQLRANHHMTLFSRSFIKITYELQLIED
ncbi:YndJ family protein [Aureibacillus halotolerans]|uniref:YndJ-like protein n=1 Tax=Aureibacillus halotolerans TaxID=1508390 RepID=A0A4R6TSZ0_9BACI|nr:YndJ family protein [Aureibacillus halotolerans]TDQ36778.1 YndJ-like protein [Aureibacillus halotolerans]